MRRLLRTWNAWRTSTAPRPAPVAPAPRRPQAANCPAAYSAVYHYLEHRYASKVVLTFLDIEALLGFPLPDDARTDGEWWTGTALTADHHAEAWLAAERTALPNLAARTVAFSRAS